MKILGFLGIIGLFLFSCQSSKPYISQDAQNNQSHKYSETEIQEIIYLIGDAGNPQLFGPTEPTLVWLQNQLQTDKVTSTVVFLGDNIYPNGLPPESDKQGYSIAVQKLEEQ
ncbi:MAG: hypothetical protein NZ108_08220, partial [Bacteroidia bacterium]|nr:hypothetical protein [Bacteroidia bacterium]